MLADLLDSLPLELTGRYPDLYEVYGSLSGALGVGREQLLLTNGVDEAIRLTYHLAMKGADGGKARSVMVPSPTFAMYEVYAASHGFQPVRLSYGPPTNRFVLRIDDIVDRLRRHRPWVLFLANPDSPTGAVLSVEQIADLACFTAQTDTVLFIDEAYFPFHPESCLTLVRKFDHLLVARSFDKAMGLAGWRLGALVGSEPLITAITRGRSMYEIGAVQAYVLAGMLRRADEIEVVQSDIRQAKKTFEEDMRSGGVDVLETGGNFSLLRLGEHQDGVRRAMAGRVLFREFSSPGPMNGLTRFSIVHPDAARVMSGVIQEAVRETGSG